MNAPAAVAEAVAVVAVGHDMDEAAGGAGVGVIVDDEEAAERRFFDRWTAKQRGFGNDPLAVDRGGPPPTRDIPPQRFSEPPPLPQGGIIGLFPEPGGSR